MDDNDNKTVNILLVGQDPSGFQPIFNICKAHSWGMEQASDGLEALEVMQAETPDLVLLDLIPQDTDGFHILRLLRRVRPELPVVLLCCSAGAHKKGIRLGARDCILKPLQEQQLEMVLQRNLAPALVKGMDAEGEDIEQDSNVSFFFADSPTMHHLRAQAKLLAKDDAPILIVGESGSGKETVARLIHQFSTRSECRFLKVDCAALPGDVLERELFGYARGSFAGVLRSRRGKLELCNKGTILLEEIVDLPATLQAKLLHVLQDRQIFRVGGDTTIAVDVRILVSSSGDIEQAIAKKKLSEDLYSRLSTFTVHVPSLRQRKQEIPLLLNHFMHQMAMQFDLPIRPFPLSMLEVCQSYAWPGNVRELENFVKRYLVSGDEESALKCLNRNVSNGAGDGHLEDRSELDRDESTTTVRSEGRPSNLRSLVASVKGETERNAIAIALAETHWNRKAAAQLLKISYRTLLYKIEQYQMSPPPYLSSAGVAQAARGNRSGR